MQKRFYLMLLALLCSIVTAWSQQANSVTQPTGDAWIIKDNQTFCSNGKELEMKTWTGDSPNTFYGVMRFQFTAPATGYRIKSATLRLTTRYKKGDDKVRMYALNGVTVTDASTYGDLEGAITTALAGSYIAEFKLKGDAQWAPTDNISDAYKTVTAWQNSIDLTAFVKGLTTNSFSVLLQKVYDQNNSSQIFSKEAEDITLKDNSTFAAADLWPQLTVEYEPIKAMVEEGGNVTYAETLNEAFGAITTSGTITLYDNITVTGLCDTKKGDVKKTITIVPAKAGITISSTMNNSILLLARGDALTVGSDQYTLTIDGGSVDNSSNPVEASGGNTTFNNVRFVNCVTTTSTLGGVICAKTGGSLYLKNVTFEDCTTKTGTGIVFAGHSNVFLQGVNTFTGCNETNIFVEKNHTLTGADATHITPISIRVESTRAAGTLVKNGTVAQYTVTGAAEGYTLGQDDDNVVLNAPAAPNVVNEATNTNYNTLAEALASVGNGETVTFLVNVDQEINSRVDVKNKDITLKAGNSGVKISRAESYTNGLCFLTMAPDDEQVSNLTIEGIVLDGQNIEATSAFIEAANNGTTILKDVQFQNCKNVKTDGLDASIIVNKSNGKLTLDGVTMTGCSVPDGKGFVFVGTNGVTLAGTNSISSIYVENNYALTANNASATSPITLITDNNRTWGLLVLGGDASQFSNGSFRLSQQTDGVYTMPKAVVASYSHPALLHTSADIARIKDNLDKEPFKSTYNRLVSLSGVSSGVGAVEVLKRMDKNNWEGTYADYDNFTKAASDAKLAYELALRYQLTGSPSCANVAVNIMNDWATNCKGFLRLPGYNNNIPDPNEYLMTIQAYQFANAAELLRNYNGWQATDFEKFQNWMRQTFADVAILFLENHHKESNPLHYWLNWDLAALNAMLSVGILCDDAALVDYALAYPTSGNGNGNVNNAIVATHNDSDSDETLAQCQESGRDQGHATLNVTLLGVLCQTAQNIGTDLWTSYKALEMAEYVGKYNLKDANGNFIYSTDKVPFTTYDNGDVTHTAISADARGTVRPSWELFHAYARNNDKSDIYTKQWVDYMRQLNAYGEAESTSTDELGFGTLMFGEAVTTSYTLTVTEAGAATLVLPFGAALPTGVKAYTLNYTAGNDKVKATEVDAITANQPVLINAEAGDYTFTSNGMTNANSPVYGALNGVYATKVVPSGAYILTNESGVVGFRKVNDYRNYVTANHAYLMADGAGASKLDIDFGGVTGVNDVRSKMADVRSDIYNLNGQRVSQPSKGMYIVNGKKVIMK